jgi:hypothetical protein
VKIGMRIVGAFACVLVLGACSSASNADHPHPTGDSSAELACGNYRGMVSDAKAGVVNDREIRKELQGVYSDARLSDTPGIAESARQMLAALTNGFDKKAFDLGIRGMNRACSAAGF